MKNLFAIALIVFLFNGFASAQSYETNEKAQAQIRKLEFLVGNWEGSGWRMGADRVKEEFTQTEKISFKLDSTAILIEGRGVSEANTVMQAMAIITSAEEEDTYDFVSYLPSGQKGSFKSELIDGAYYWYPAESVRYITRINEKGQWLEIGEFNQGENWYPFFEMILDKKQ